MFQVVYDDKDFEWEKIILQQKNWITPFYKLDEDINFTIMGGPAKVGKRILYSLDNFYIAPFTIRGKEYMSSECYFQAMKAKN